MKKHLFTFVVLMLFASVAWAQKLSPVGIWTNEDGKAKFEIYKCGDKLCGKLVTLKEPLKNGKPKVDENNPNKKLATRPLQGLEFMKGFKYDGDNKWDDGTIYDPESGKTYACYMKMNGNDKMEVKGYIGISLIGRTQHWTRVQ
ncbi:DUF2147 domain-containing protein [Pontibacter arcticus]|nr:DUF2147 domain-containing protein [Pontibacter arcticus]